jgi:hypothetical protein
MNRRKIRCPRAPIRLPSRPAEARMRPIQQQEQGVPPARRAGGQGEDGGDGSGAGQQRHGQWHEQLVRGRLVLVVVLHPGGRAVEHFQPHQQDHQPARGLQGRHRDAEGGKDRPAGKRGNRQDDRRGRRRPARRPPSPGRRQTFRHGEEYRQRSQRVRDREDGHDVLQQRFHAERLERPRLTQGVILPSPSFGVALPEEHAQVDLPRGCSTVGQRRR